MISRHSTSFLKQNLYLSRYCRFWKYTDYEIMYFRVAVFAAILALVGAGEATAIAPRDWGLQL